MLVVNIEDIKGLVSRLVSTNFDNMLLHSMEVKTSIFLQIDGRINREFFDSDDTKLAELGDRQYTKWGDIKNLFFDAIKGDTLPLSFKLVLMPDSKFVEWFIKEYGLSYKKEDIGGLFMNILYERGNLNITTGTSLKIFTMDKSLDNAWESCIKALLKNAQIV